VGALDLGRVEVAIERVEPGHPVAGRDQPLAGVRANEPGGTSDHDVHG
jgi:hypothetical protein